MVIHEDANMGQLADRAGTSMEMHAHREAIAAAGLGRCMIGGGIGMP